MGQGMNDKRLSMAGDQDALESLEQKLQVMSWTPKIEPVHLWWKLVLILTDEEVQEDGQEGEGRKDSGVGEWARRGIQGACRIGGLQR